MTKKVLILSYYWPPAGGGGVQRWLKMSKYIPDLGWTPIIYTAENGEIGAYDESLVTEIRPEVQVIKHPIWEPYSFYKQFLGRKKEEKVFSGFISEGKGTGLMQKISVFIRGNFFIPDARCFWIRPSIAHITEYLKNNPVDAIVSTGPPHSMHRIALGLKKKFPHIPWVADFRDPWTHIDFYDQLMLTPLADYMHKSMEKEVLSKADKIVTVSWAWAEDFKQISKRDDIQVITNGYDPADFEGMNAEDENVFTITHIGSMNPDRNPRVLWNALKSIVSKNPAFECKIKLVGQVDFSIIEDIKKAGLERFLQHIPFIPHKQAIIELRKSQVLLLPINDTPNQAGVLPGKLYEYIGANRNILCIGRNSGDAAKILSSISSAQICGYEEVSKCEEIIIAFYKNNEKIQNSGYEKYSRKTLAGDYVGLLNSIIKSKN